MKRVWVLVVSVLVAGSVALDAQQKPAARRAAANVTLAIAVSDPAGTPVPDVLVTAEGPTPKTVRTEGGRIALEGLRAGSYLLRFEHEGFVTVERELTARAGKPIDVKVTLKPLPAPPPPPAAPEPPAIDAKPMAADLPALIEKEWIGKAPSRTSPLACGAGGTSTLIQLNQPLTQQVHAEADTFFYVVAGEGVAQVGTGQLRLKAGVFLFVPRGMSHGLTPSGRNPLIVMSTRAGEPCK